MARKYPITVLTAFIALTGLRMQQHCGAGFIRSAVGARNAKLQV
jgi:hypothetical protein